MAEIPVIFRLGDNREIGSVDFPTVVVMTLVSSKNLSTLHSCRLIEFHSPVLVNRVSAFCNSGKRVLKRQRTFHIDSRQEP